MSSKKKDAAAAPERAARRGAQRAARGSSDHSSGVHPRIPEAPRESLSDIDQLRLQRELELVWDRYRALHDGMPSGHLVLDALGSVLVANLALATLLGRERDTLIGCKLARFMNASDAQMFRAHRLHVFRAHEPATCDIAFTRPDGTSVRVRLDSAYADDAGTPECRTTVVALSEQRRLENARRSEAIGVVAAGIAHDFNNLLTGILAFAESCLNQIGREHPTRERMQEILSAALTGATLVKQLMSLGSTSTAHNEPLHFDSALAALAPMLQRLIGERAALRVQLDAVNAYVACEPGQIEQVILNLVINARQAVTHTGTIHVSSREQQLSPDEAQPLTVRPGAFVRLEVRDDGVGMDEDTLARACEPRFTTKGNTQGSGLGLATVAAIVRGAHGHLEIGSAPGSGTRVVILLPSQPPPSHARAHEGQHAHALHGTETVLLVEDDALVCAAAREHLERAGYDVVCAASGSDALRACAARAGKIDLVLTDILLPGGMLGIELARQVGAVAPDAAIAFMSAYPPRTLQRDGRLSPGVASLEKPFTREALLLHVRASLDR